jgi:RDD family
MALAAPYSEEYRLQSASPPPADQLRDALFPALSRLTFGLVGWRPWQLHLGPVQLLRFGPPQAVPDGWAWPIEGGLLAARRGGATGVGSRPGEIRTFMKDYRPRLPAPLYRLTQLRVHRLMSRIFLLQQRGRQPPPGVPAPPVLRLAAAAVDLAVCAAAAQVLPRGRRVAGGILLTAIYHVGWWSLGGRTAGARLLGLQVVSLDGAKLSPGQSLLRFLAVPGAILTLRAGHDELAGTEVITHPMRRT